MHIYDVKNVRYVCAIFVSQRDGSSFAQSEDKVEKAGFSQKSRSMLLFFQTSFPGVALQERFMLGDSYPG